MNTEEKKVIYFPEPDILCRPKFKENDSIKDIFIYSTDIKTEIKGVLSIAITFDTIFFDTINPLTIEDMQIQSIRIRDTITNKYIIKYTKYQENIDNQLFDFCETNLMPILQKYDCWMVNNQKEYFPVKRIMYNFPFRIIPIKDLNRN